MQTEISSVRDPTSRVVEACRAKLFGSRALGFTAVELPLSRSPSRAQKRNQPLNNFLLVKLVDVVDKTDGGILLTEQDQDGQDGGHGGGVGTRRDASRFRHRV
jgi:hypothetical protein